MKAYVEPEKDENDSYPGWLEDGTIDKELYYFSTARERLDTFNPLTDVEAFSTKVGTGLSAAIYEGGSLRSNMESAYNQDMQALIDLGFVPAEVFKPFETEGAEGGEDSGEESGESGETEGSDEAAE